MARWRLYIDESGNFDQPSSRALVGAVLMEEGLQETCEAWIQNLLQRTAPEIPWPFHATETRAPLNYLLWPLTGKAEVARGLESHLTELDGVMDNLAGERWRKLRAAVSEGQSWSKCVDENRELFKLLKRKRPAVAGQLFRAMMAVRQKITKVIRQRIQPCSRILQVHAIVDEPLAGDQYLAALPAVLQRSAEIVLDSQPAVEDDEIRVLAQQRHVLYPVINTSGPLLSRQIAEAIVRYSKRSSGYLYHAGRGVRVVPEEPRALSSAGDVLADFVANQAFHELFENSPLGDIEGSLIKKTGLPCRLLDGGTGLAAAGVAFEELCRIRGTATVVSLPGGTRPWVREQFQDWSARRSGGATR